MGLQRLEQDRSPSPTEWERGWGEGRRIQTETLPKDGGGIAILSVIVPATTNRDRYLHCVVLHAVEGDHAILGDPESPLDYPCTHHGRRDWSDDLDG